MSYSHPILVPGATGHEDIEALHKVIEELAGGPTITEWRSLLEDIDEVKMTLADIEDKLHNEIDLFVDAEKTQERFFETIEYALDWDGIYYDDASGALDTLKDVLKGALTCREALSNLVKSMEHTYSQADRY